MKKPATTDHAIHALLRERWSNRAFADRPVPEADVAALLEAARWAPSAFNAQPWRFVYGHKGDPTFARIADLLVEGNAWAKEAGLLVLTATRTRYAHNDKPNRHAWHDLGLAVMSLVLEATERGLGVHQMAGFDADGAREAFSIPEPFAPVTVVAIGFPGAPEVLPDGLRERELAPRSRKPAAALFSGTGWPKEE